MKGLLYKDFLLSKLVFIVHAIFTFGIYLGGIFMLDELNGDGTDLYLVKGLVLYFPFFMASLVNADMLKPDEKRVWCNFVISSPQSCRGQILSKYVMLLITNLYIFVLALTMDLISCAKLGGIESSAWKLLLIYVAMNTILNAIEVPFMVRFGSSRGMQIKGSLFGAIVSIITIYFLFGNLNFFRKHNFFDWLLDLVMSSPDVNAICIWLCSIAVVLYAVSCFISTKLYRAGVEAYEN